YGNLGLREFGDLDLLLRAADLARARRLLRTRGYRPQYPLSPGQERAYLRSLCQLPFVRDDGVVVELHSALTPRAFHFPLSLVELWHRRITLAVAGKPVAAPSPEDLLLILCMHGAKHLWKYLGWVCDVAEVLRAHPAVDWDVLRGQARRLRSRRL